ncbi:aspartyl protease family protein [Sphingomonas caeni]|uniref:aspartyl protease family protein n=1 Tax=Sphingomonas caeni TaxID=2984949 RepID=UPI00222FD9D8|nr:aspartyl protease family protein [Sphingomonas caeni]
MFLLLPLGAVANGPSSPHQDPDAVNAAVDGTMLNLRDADSRLTVQVAVGNKGPYNFIIDTGAERTVVSSQLAGQLQLAPGAPISMTSMTENSMVDTVIVPELSIESIGIRHTIIAPSLDARNLGAAGLLGIDTLSKHQVSIDFETGVMTVRPSEPRRKATPESSDEIVVTAKSKFGQLIVTDAFFGGTRIQVVLDTGSAVSMGNTALRRLVGQRTKGPMQTVELTSVTGGRTTADYTLVPKVRIGDVVFDTLPVAFAEVVPFKRFGLSRRPALLLGMDALRSFRRVDIDFPNRQVRFLMPRGARHMQEGPQGSSAAPQRGAGPAPSRH